MWGQAGGEFWTQKGILCSIELLNMQLFALEITSAGSKLNLNTKSPVLCFFYFNWVFTRITDASAQLSHWWLLAGGPLSLRVWDLTYTLCKEGEDSRQRILLCYFQKTNRWGFFSLFEEIKICWNTAGNCLHNEQCPSSGLHVSVGLLKPFREKLENLPKVSKLTC